jgi:hypothetical protein
MFGWLSNLGASRVLSLVIAAGYFCFFLFAPGPLSMQRRIGTLLLVAVYLLGPLLCIWFGDEMGDYSSALPGLGLDKPTPGCLIKIAGWVLLFLPIMLLLILANQ